MDTEKRLNTIRFYIILKLCVIVAEKKFRLNTIRFYIILKLATVLLSLDWVEYYTFLHHSQTMRYSRILKKWVEYYTFLHHSQSREWSLWADSRLNTIRFYIILKLAHAPLRRLLGLNTIRFYIILKPQIKKRSASYTQNL